MEIKEWIDKMSGEGLVCREYMRKIAAAESKKDLFRIMCDVNGGARLFELHAGGVQVPKDVILSEFGQFVNGKNVVEYPQGYTSKFYCGHRGDVVADTTVLYLFESVARLCVPSNSFPMVYISSGSIVNFVMGSESRIRIEMFGNSSYSVEGDTSNVYVKRH